MNLKSAHTGKVGKAFINARISRSMTQKEVADATLINIEYIKAIELGDYAIFPARVFALLYFKKYAKFLNLEIQFFDIYNAKVVAAADKELESNLPSKSFFKKNIPEVAEVISEETLSNEQDFKIESEFKLEDDINELHNEINNFFIQDKLDSIHLDVTVDASEPKA
jgi:transcriptional regulator with XRE-family HTH domain